MDTQIPGPIRFATYLMAFCYMATCGCYGQMFAFFIFGSKYLNAHMPWSLILPFLIGFIAGWPLGRYEIKEQEKQWREHQSKTGPEDEDHRLP